MSRANIDPDAVRQAWRPYWQAHTVIRVNRYLNR